VYTDEAAAYRGMPLKYEAVNHSVGEYAHTNGIESFWAMLKRAHKGTFHHFSEKHLHRYVTEFAGRNNVREEDTIVQMRDVMVGMIGKRLMYRELVAD
ncbi:MAG: transposase, partial [Alphaproteobacteria bacterium]|nr:transposase [Alphaproteobacteria bacterium]